MTAVCVLAALAAAAVILRRIRRAEARDLASYHRKVRTVDQVMDDVRRWRADQRMRQAVADIAICEALWNLPTIPHQRKETGQ